MISTVESVPTFELQFRTPCASVDMVVVVVPEDLTMRTPYDVLAD
ncbi:hypothetical protein [Cohnella silvisoli]|uniref:Uncharacterized protein n=1 Tax=Cohnella silvisoli TaxID=2873699 RepID=A0ABV1KU73_9BACL|nr:hypothetical protein [Cohnella silvisoli]